MTRSSFGDAQSAQMTLQTPFRMRAFLLALTLVLLAGCANVAPLLSAILTNQVAFTPGQLQTQLDRRFPRDYQQANGLVTLRVLNPRLSIVPGTSRLRLDFDVGVGALGRAPSGSDSHFAVSSGIRFDTSRMGLMLDSPAVEDVNLNSLSALNGPARTALTNWLQDYAANEPVYTLDAQTQAQLRGREISSTLIQNGMVVVNLRPASAGTPVNSSNNGWAQ